MSATVDMSDTFDKATPDAMKSERGLTMVWHSALIGVVAYILLTMLGGQDKPKAENNGIVIAAVALIYMILYGHSFPPTSRE